MCDDPDDGADDDVPDRTEREEGVPDFVQDRLLEHPTRQAIVDLLAKRPGMNKSQICKELDLRANVVDHHIEKLEEAQLVVTEESENGYETLCFRLEDAMLWADDRTRVLYGRRGVRAVGLFLAENPGATTREIAEALHLTTVTIRQHLRTLMCHGLVERYPAGQTNLYKPATVLEEWACEVGEGFDRRWKR